MNRIAMVTCVSLGLTACSPGPAFAQSEPVVKVDLIAAEFESKIPFDQLFKLRVAVPEGTTIDSIQYGLAKRESVPDSTARRVNGSYPFKRTVGLYDCTPTRPDLCANAVRPEPRKVIKIKDVVFSIQPLKPNKEYLFKFYVRAPEVEVVKILANPATSFKDQFDSDFGFLYAPSPGPGYFGAGSNVHVYAVPVNKDQDPADFRGFRDQFLKRVSVFAGLSFLKIKSTAQVHHLFATGTPVWGIGVRPLLSRRDLTRLVRLNIGMMHFEQDAANPLLEERVRKRAPFVGLTMDIALKEVIGPIAALVGLK